jgi:hypothetical protein
MAKKRKVTAGGFLKSQVGLDPDEVKQVLDYAEAMDLSVSQILRRAVRLYFSTSNEKNRY